MRALWCPQIVPTGTLPISLSSPLPTNFTRTLGLARAGGETELSTAGLGAVERCGGIPTSTCTLCSWRLVASYWHCL